MHGFLREGSGTEGNKNTSSAGENEGPYDIYK